MQFVRPRLLAAGGAAGATLLAGASWNLSRQEDAKRPLLPGVHTKLTSVAGNFRTEDWYADDKIAGTPCAPWSVRKRTLHGGRQEGVDEIEVRNGALSFTVLPTRGMSIGRMCVDGESWSMSNPIREWVHPQYVDLQDHKGLGWLTGFNEWMCRCGVAWSGHPGVDGERLLTLHGRVGNIPASEVEVRMRSR